MYHEKQNQVLQNQNEAEQTKIIMKKNVNETLQTKQMKNKIKLSWKPK